MWLKLGKNIVFLPIKLRKMSKKLCLSAGQYSIYNTVYDKIISDKGSVQYTVL